MEALLQKLESYNIFNFLLPGALFVILCKEFDIVVLSAENIIADLFFHYFCGMTISRVGSLIIEPLLKFLRVATYAPYSDFINASKEDGKIIILLEQNNTYRAIIALIVCLLYVYLIKYFYQKFEFSIVTLYLFLMTNLGLIYIVIPKANFIHPPAYRPL